MTNCLLRAQRLTKRFGGLTAVSDVSLDLHCGQIHAVIGPNGAGKSTLTHLLAGDLPLSSGHIELMGVDISKKNLEQVARLGLARSFQKTNVFLPFTVFQNVRLAAHFDLEQTHAALALTKLEPRADHLVSNLSHGEQRLLEVAMCLAGKPRVLILDEPLAGMGAQEALRMIDLLQRLKVNHAILLVEHDMDAVFSLADVLTVMVDGKVIACGAPELIRSDAKVQAAYLGEAHD